MEKCLFFCSRTPSGLPTMRRPFLNESTLIPFPRSFHLLLTLSIRLKSTHKKRSSSSIQFPIPIPSSRVFFFWSFRETGRKGKQADRLSTLRSKQTHPPLTHSHTEIVTWTFQRFASSEKGRWMILTLNCCKVNNAITATSILCLIREKRDWGTLKWVRDIW